MRQRYRERYLRALVPDGTEGTSDGHGGDMEEWWESAGMAYNRRVWAYEVATTEEQDERFVAQMNARPNKHLYHLKKTNCADFIAELVNVYFPNTVHNDRVADFGLMTPKEVVRCVAAYGEAHPEAKLRINQVPQVPGSLRRSKPVRGGAESGLKTKRYLFTLMVIQPEVPAALAVLYWKHGRWAVGTGAEPAPDYRQPWPPTPPAPAASRLRADLSKADNTSPTPHATPPKNKSRIDLTAAATHCLIGRMDKADKDAIREVLAGDRDAYRILVDSHYQFVFRIAFRITADESDAEEVAQEAFLRAYNKLATFRQDASFSTWVNRIAMNTAINLVERRSRDLGRTADRIGESSDPNDGTTQVAASGAGPDRLLLDREAATLRESAMATLTPMERTAFTLRHMEDMPISEIAAALNVPANSAKQAVFRAVSKLRQSLAPLAGGVR